MLLVHSVLGRKILRATANANGRPSHAYSLRWFHHLRLEPSGQPAPTHVVGHVLPC